LIYDAIVVGLGAMGSAAAYHLARRGRRVLGLDAFAPGHRFGSSHGYTRVIRKAYFEDPAYVPLLHRAYELWAELSQETGEPLYRQTGGLWLGPNSAAVVDGALVSARRHGVAYELLSQPEVRRRFPVFAPREDMVALWEPDAGVLFPERCILAHLAGAARAGADLRYNEPALTWNAGGDHAAVETAGGRYEAALLVVTSGAWAPAVLKSLSLPIEATRRITGWFAPASARQAPLLRAGACPVWICDVDGTNIYGVPDFDDGHGLKAAIHERGPACTPETCRRDIGDDEIAQLTAVLRRVLPGAAGRLLEAETCLYTMTPDWHFIIDRPAAQRALLYATGFSGHGFKFAAVIGEILADLAVDGRTSHEIQFLSPARFTGAAPPRT
jgi:sarcosine oxidase